MEKIKYLLQEFSTASDSNNFMQFTAVAGYIGKPSDKTPCGSKPGYHVAFDPNVAGLAVSKLVGMGVNCSWDGDGSLKKHNKNFKIGVIDKAYVDEDKIMVEGHLWKLDFADICDTIESAKEALGCSVEVLLFELQEDAENKLQIATQYEFTGLSILFKDKAAFMNTQLMCAALEEGEEELTDAELKAAQEAHEKIVMEKIDVKLQEFSEKLEPAVKTITEFAATQAAAPTNPVPAEPATKVDPAPTADFAAIIDVMKVGFESLRADFAAKPEPKEIPQRKTKMDFSGLDKNEGKEDKTIMEFAEEIDKNPNLSESDKWQKKAELWAKAQHEAE